MNLRYERKYLLEDVDYRAIAAEIRINPAGFRVQHPDRKVNNIYFDTIEYSALHTNLYGVAERTKFRLRWYGESPLPGPKVRWEEKQKYNTLGAKVVQEVPFDDWKSIKDVVKTVNKHFRTGHDHVPSLMNSYVRSYFVSPDRKFRMTIDRELRFTPIRGNRPVCSIPHNSSNVIVELKYDQEHDDAANEILKYIPFRQTKSSKYVSGTMLGM